MLYKEALPTQLWDLLQSLMGVEPLDHFFLVGGTALALRLGHRESVDIDLFSVASFDAPSLADYLTRTLPAERIYHEPDTVRAIISGIKVDLLRHSYPLLDRIETLDGIRIAALPDLIAMKLNAVSGRGLKKDFYDVAALLKSFSLEQMLGFFKTKYSSGDLWHLIRSLEYYVDAEADPTLISSIWTIDWDDVKSSVSAAVNELPKA